MFCAKCGKLNNDGAKFCKGCGSPLGVPIPIDFPEPPNLPVSIPGQEPAQVYAPTPIPGQEPAPAYTPAPIPGQEPAPAYVPTPIQTQETQSVKSKKAKVSPAVISLIIAIIVVLVAILGVLAYLLFIKDGGVFGKDKVEETPIETEINDDGGTGDSEPDTGDDIDIDVVDVVPDGNDEPTDEGGETGEGNEVSEQSWQDAYLDFIDSEEGRTLIGECESYSLIYVNDDDIPELVLRGNCEAAGCVFVTYADGAVDKYQTARLNFDYVERGNAVCNSDGHSGYYYDIIFGIENGKWTEIANGAYSEMIHDDGSYSTTYEWNNVEVSESEYASKMNSVYDSNRAKQAEEIPMVEVQSYLRNGTYASAGHRYELVIEDVHWIQAEALCRNKGGYLASITCREEFDNIVNQIRDEDKTKYTFYVGGTRMNDYTGGSYQYEWVHDGVPIAMGYYGNDDSRMWHANEPSYSGEDANGNQVDENCVDLYFSKSDGRAYLNDVSDTILRQAPFYSGSIGYICEYDY